MLTFNLKKEWFEKIKSGEKTHEYREVKEYWTSRFGNIPNIVLPITYIQDVAFFRLTDNNFIETLNIPCLFKCGYPSKNENDKIIKGIIKTIKRVNGKNTDLAIDKDVYDIEFELI